MLKHIGMIGRTPIRIRFKRRVHQGFELFIVSKTVMLHKAQIGEGRG